MSTNKSPTKECGSGLDKKTEDTAIMIDGINNNIDITDSSDDDDDDDDDGGEVTFQTMAAAKKKGSGVRFGSVRVHKHNLTLGDNPSTKTVGPPLTLDWNVAESLRYETVDCYSMEEYGKLDSLVQHQKPTTIEGNRRQQIAAIDHSSNSIRKLQYELYDIKQKRIQSSKEDIELATKLEEERQEKLRNKRGGLFGGIFHNIFHKK